jgi:hypothetical protein
LLRIFITNECLIPSNAFFCIYFVEIWKSFRLSFTLNVACKKRVRHYYCYREIFFTLNSHTGLIIPNLKIWNPKYLKSERELTWCCKRKILHLTPWDGLQLIHRHTKNTAHKFIDLGHISKILIMHMQILHNPRYPTRDVKPVF